jgi:hypothetical protein
MLLQKHVGYTKKIIAGMRISKKDKEQVIKGVTANDLCEFTNEGQPFFPGKDSIHCLFDQKKKLFGGIAIWQSHFGKLASLHAMSMRHGEPAATTMKDLRSWFDFLNGLALGSIRITGCSRVCISSTNSFSTVKIFRKYSTGRPG